MKRLLLLLLFTLGCHPHTPNPEAPAPVNVVLGDASFVETFGRQPTDSDGEVLRTRTHLLYVVESLRAAAPDLEPDVARRRTEALDALEAYARRGLFPINRHVPGRQPRFVDEAGTLCAVGFLYARDHGRETLPVSLADEYRTIAEIRSPELAAWAGRTGFSTLELAMIQPSYHFRPRPKPVPTLTDRLAAAASQWETCRQAAGEAPADLLIEVTPTGPGQLSWAARSYPDRPKAMLCLGNALRAQLRPPFKGPVTSQRLAIGADGKPLARPPLPRRVDDTVQAMDLSACASGGAKVARVQLLIGPDGRLQELEFDQTQQLGSQTMKCIRKTLIAGTFRPQGATTAHGLTLMVGQRTTGR